MSRSHSKKGSHTAYYRPKTPTRQFDQIQDRRQIYLRNPDEALMRFHYGELDKSTAVGLLERGGAGGYANRQAGRLCLEEALLASDGNEVTNWAARAEHNFKLAIEKSKLQPGGEDERFIAQLQLNQMPLAIYKKFFGTMPPTDLVKRVYEQSVQTSQAGLNDLIALTKNPTQLVRSKHDANRFGNTNLSTLTGALCETSILLLGQRFAIDKLGDGSWLSLLSLYSEDNANTDWVGKQVMAGWDVSIYADIGDGIKLTNRLQVRSKRSTTPELPPINGVQYVYHEDLALPSVKNGVNWTISELIAEQTGSPEERAKATVNLDAREELLLEIIG